MSALSRTSQVLLALAGHNHNGLPNSAIAKAIGSSDPTTLRTLQQLDDAGLVERVPGEDKRWRLTAFLVQIAIAHQREVAREEQRLADFNQRYTRKPL